MVDKWLKGHSHTEGKRGYGLKLSRKAFSLAVDFIRENARQLDRTLYEFHSEDGSEDAVVTELVKYQNSDGGFGHAIEPDFRLQSSSPMATSVGLQYCVDIDLDPSHEIVKSAIDYLVSTYDSENGFWPATNQDVNDEPHAPWWHVEKITAPEEKNWANPSAELFGYMHRYSFHVPGSFLKRINKMAQENLEMLEYFEGFYNILCWQRAYLSLPEPLSSSVRKKIYESYVKLGPLTPEILGGIRIEWLAPSSDSILTRTYPGVVYHHLESSIERQSEDGGWWPTWKWGLYEDVWPIAEKEWAGKITLDFLRCLRSHNLNDSLIVPM